MVTIFLKKYERRSSGNKGEGVCEKFEEEGKVTN